MRRSESWLQKYDTSLAAALVVNRWQYDSSRLLETTDASTDITTSTVLLIWEVRKHRLSWFCRITHITVNQEGSSWGRINYSQNLTRQYSQRAGSTDLAGCGLCTLELSNRREGLADQRKSRKTVDTSSTIAGRMRAADIAQTVRNCGTNQGILVSFLLFRSASPIPARNLWPERRRSTRNIWMGLICGDPVIYDTWRRYGRYPEDFDWESAQPILRSVLKSAIRWTNHARIIG